MRGGRQDRNLPTALLYLPRRLVGSIAGLKKEAGVAVFRFIDGLCNPGPG
jgi:hypothetical protein